jgi:hypothetical protein
MGVSPSEVGDRSGVGKTDKLHASCHYRVQHPSQAARQMLMHRIHSASLIRNAALTPFTRDLKLLRNTDPHTEFYVVYSKQLKGL